MDFYQILLDIMEERKLSIPEIARLCGLTDSTVRSMIDRKQKKVALNIAFKLSEGLGVSLERLNGDKEKISNNPSSFSFIDKEKMSSDETDMIKKYRLLDDRGKAAVQETVNREYSYVMQKTVNLSEAKKTGRTQTVRIASRNGPSTLTLNEEQLKAARELLKKIEENPDPDIDDDLI